MIRPEHHWNIWGKVTRLAELAIPEGRLHAGECVFEQATGFDVRTKSVHLNDADGREAVRLRASNNGETVYIKINGSEEFDFVPGHLRHESERRSWRKTVHAQVLRWHEDRLTAADNADREKAFSELDKAIGGYQREKS